MNLNKIKSLVQNVLAGESNIVFAYLHGSTLSSPNPRDLDIAVYINKQRYDQLRQEGAPTFDFTVPLEIKIEKAVGTKVDLQLLNEAPLPFRYRIVTQGVLLIDRDPLTRSDFESLARMKYQDFQPYRNQYFNHLMTDL